MSSRAELARAGGARGTSPSSDHTPVFLESVGTTLQREREVRALSLEEIARVTRIPLRSLRQLEQDDLDALPGDVFARGFVRAYGRALGMPARELGDLLTRLGPEPPTPVAPPPSVAREARRESPGLVRRAGTVVALLLLAALFALAVSVMLTPRRTRSVPRTLSEAPSTSPLTLG